MAGTPLTTELVDKLLDKLGSDDKFRTEFGQDPEAAMHSLGAPKSFTCGPCLRPKALVAKEEIRKTRETIKNALLGKGGHEVHCLGGN
jgi:putative modified peptide